MPENWPAAALFVLLFGVAFARAGATYALARGARHVGSRHTALLERPGVARAERGVRRYGAPVVTLCFLTVGVQTAVHLAAGSLRMPLSRYLPALALGALVWATVYLTIGFAVVEVVVAPWAGR